MSDKLRVCDINGLVRRAEHEISYLAKRAIEAYYPIWQRNKEPEFSDGFLECAHGFYLLPFQIKACRKLMAEFGMTKDAKPEETELREKLDRFKFLLEEEKKSNDRINEMRRFHRKLVNDRKRAHDEYSELVGKKKLESEK